MTGARTRGRRRAALAAASVAAALALAPAACGKKSPPRLPDQVAAEKAATPRASVREGRLTLEFSVPAHRIFPEREDPWVLARVLRQDPPAKDFVEVGAILERDGFAFEAPLTWGEAARTAGSSAYRVEFRDGVRRRRALSEAVTISWQAPPAAPGGLAAAGDDRGVALTWAPPAESAGARYRVYRREVPDGQLEILTPEPLAATGHADSRIRPSREYCYQVRAVLGETASAVEGPPSAEACVRTEDATPPPPPGTVQITATPGGIQITWEDVSAPDLLGYRVYRAIDDGPLELLTPAPIGGTAYREETRDARAGARYRYVVTAVDASTRANESPFSPAAEAAAVPPAGAP